MTAGCPTAQVDLIRDLGADTVIDSTTDSLTRAGADHAVVFDAVDKRSFGACRSLLRSGEIPASTDPGRFWQNPLLVLGRE